MGEYIPCLQCWCEPKTALKILVLQNVCVYHTGAPVGADGHSVLGWTRLGLSFRASRGRVAELGKATPAQCRVRPPMGHVLGCVLHVPLTASR